MCEMGTHPQIIRHGNSTEHLEAHGFGFHGQLLSPEQTEKEKVMESLEATVCFQKRENTKCFLHFLYIFYFRIMSLLSIFFVI